MKCNSGKSYNYDNTWLSSSILKCSIHSVCIMSLRIDNFFYQKGVLSFNISVIMGTVFVVVMSAMMKTIVETTVMRTSVEEVSVLVTNLHYLFIQHCDDLHNSTVYSLNTISLYMYITVAWV